MQIKVVVGVDVAVVVVGDRPVGATRRTENRTEILGRGNAPSAAAQQQN